MSDLTHYVYRVFDEHGLLLYIGCTGAPEKRRSQHERRATWAQYAADWRLVGPLPKAEGFALEARLIEVEKPWFNVTLEEKWAVRKFNTRYETRAISARLLPEPARSEYLALLDAEAEAEPIYDRDWRLAAYLNARFDAQAGAA